MRYSTLSEWLLWLFGWIEQQLASRPLSIAARQALCHTCVVAKIFKGRGNALRISLRNQEKKERSRFRVHAYVYQSFHRHARYKLSELFIYLMNLSALSYNFTTEIGIKLVKDL